jgi:hypothetical protein
MAKKKRARRPVAQPDKEAVPTHDPPWPSGLSGRLAGQGFMGLPPPRNPPGEAMESKADDITLREERQVDHSHETDADRRGEQARGG